MSSEALLPSQVSEDVDVGGVLRICLVVEVPLKLFQYIRDHQKKSKLKTKRAKRIRVIQIISHFQPTDQAYASNSNL